MTSPAPTKSTAKAPVKPARKRPAVIGNKELAELILAHMSAGHSLGAVCSIAKIAKSTVLRRSMQDDALADAIEQGRDAFLYYWERELIFAARGQRGKDAVRACELALRTSRDWVPIDMAPDGPTQQMLVQINGRSADL